jgi:hypothetical protein
MKNKKVKEIHLRVPLKLSEEIESKEKAKTKNETYVRALYKSTKYNDILVRIDKLENEINIIKNYNRYIIFLLEQVYVDLDFEKRDKNKSKNLIELKNEFRKKQTKKP